MVGTWLKGTVSAVDSGDRLVISGPPRPNGPPLKKELALSSLAAPRLGRRDGSTPDEPFAWQSREFLRRLAIGKACTFRVDYTSDTGRNFGVVFLSSSSSPSTATAAAAGNAPGDVDVALRVASEGWAKVKPTGGASSAAAGQQQAPSASSSSYHEELVAASAAAEAAGKGIFSKKSGGGGGGDVASSSSSSSSGPRYFSSFVDSSASSAEEAAEALLAAAGGKGAKLRGIVEYCSSGSSLRATLFAAAPSSSSSSSPPPGSKDVLPARGVPLILAGAVSPSMAPAAKPATAEGAPAPPPAPADPYAPVARHFTESRLLHRDALVELAGVDKHGNLVASVSLLPASSSSSSDASPASTAASVAAGSTDIALALVGAGLARAAEWGLQMLPSSSSTGAAARLREAERAARGRRAGIWKSYTPPAGATTRPSGASSSGNAAASSNAFRGTVAEVVSGDVLSIRVDGATAGNAEERRVCLSSTRAPRLGRRDPGTGRVEGGEPLAAEAKEFLRSRLIGKVVDVRVEYERRVPAVAGGGGGAVGGAGGGAAAAAEKVLSFAAVTLPPSTSSPPGGGGGGGANVAELLLSRGLATVARHRADDERAAGYDRLLEAEAAARAKKKGVHGVAATAADGATATAATTTSVRINDVTVPGSSARAKAYLPSFTRAPGGKVQGVVEFVFPSAAHKLKIFVPKESVVVAFALSEVRVASDDAAAASEAAALVRRLALQRDVELSVENCDRAGTFLGNIAVPSSENGSSPSSSSSSSTIDLATALVRAGLAKVTPMATADGGPRVEALLESQEGAKAARRGCWRSWDAEAEARAAAAEEAAAAAAASSTADADGGIDPSSSSFEKVDVVVTDVRSFDDLSVQFAGEPRVEWIASTLRGAALDVGGELLGGPPARGSLVAAKFSADGQWYRARVDGATSDGGARVTFIDFGNSERVPPSSLRRLPAELAATPPQAHTAKLAFLKKPPTASRNDNEDDEKVDDDDDDVGAAASDFVASRLGGGAPLEALVVSRGATARSGQQGKALSLIISLGEEDKGSSASASAAAAAAAAVVASSVNAELLRSGYLRLDKPRLLLSSSSSRGRAAAAASAAPAPPQHVASAVSALEAAQDEAKRSRSGIWEYGDCGGDSDDDDGRGQRPRRGGRGGGGGGGGAWGSRR